MTETPITSYLAQLDRELRLKRAPRRRLLEEVADHLRSSAADLDSSTRDPESEAVRRFGAAAVVARRFAHAAASTSSRVALVWAVGAFVSYAIAAGLFSFVGPSWLRDFPQGAASSVALQISAVALVVSTIRALRWRGQLIDQSRLRFVASGVLIAALALVAGAAAELLFAVTRPAAAPWEDMSGIIAAYVLAALVALVAAFVAVANAARVGALGTMPGEPGELRASSMSLIDDVAATAPPLAPAARVALAHPGRTCLAVAIAAFIAFAALNASGTDFTEHASIVLGAAATGLFEASAVVVAYLTLGRALGLRPDTRAAEA